MLARCNTVTVKMFKTHSNKDWKYANASTLISIVFRIHALFTRLAIVCTVST
uniref:Uncharacterized protein n=1 Tax=Anguilla anguilla TaxID=7936 RepID=A0A0E9QVZ7_ANGAN